MDLPTADPYLVNVLRDVRQHDATALKNGEHLAGLLADLAPNLPAPLYRACVAAATADVASWLSGNSTTPPHQVAAWLRGWYPDLQPDATAQVVAAFAALNDQAAADRSAFSRPTVVVQPPKRAPSQPAIPPAIPPAQPPGLPRPPSRRRRWPLAVAVAVVVAAGAFAAGWFATRHGDTTAGRQPRLAHNSPHRSAPPRKAPSSTDSPRSVGPQVRTTGDLPSEPLLPPRPFRSPALYRFTRPFFAPRQCRANPTYQQAPLAQRLRRVELVECENRRYQAVLWRTATLSDLRADERLYLAKAIPGTLRILSGTPFDSARPATVQFGYLHVNGRMARVYWQVEGTRCAAELQSTNPALGPLVAFWRNGR